MSAIGVGRQPGKQPQCGRSLSGLPGRNSLPVQARLRRLIEVGLSLGMTAGDTARLASETLRALDTLRLRANRE